MTKRRMKYNPSFLTEEELIDGFVVRHADLDLIVSTIAENCTGSNQHVLVIGPRGSGKTTMVRRVAAEIARTEELHAGWFPLIFAEESYEVVSAGEFWLEALFHLAEQTGDEKWLHTYRELKNETDDQRLGERALAQLLDFADSIGKRILVIVENLNMLLGDMTSEDEAWKIRHTLLNEPRLMLLATATCRFEHIENASKAMFEMFKMQELKPLDGEECNLVWEHITGHKLPGERITPIRILTGGNPRLLAIIAKFSAHRSFHKLLDDLVNLIDDHTEYFKSHLDGLPPTERKVYLALCSLWDASTAREIAREARIDINRTSSLLSRLVNRGAVTIEPNSKKTKWFVVAERMYNIYYLMRRRGKPADRVRATVKFLTSMYDHESAARLITEEACGLPPELRDNHCLAYEAAIAEIRDHEVVRKIIATTPREFLESPYLNQSIKNFVSGHNGIASKIKPSEPTNEELEELMSINAQGIEHGKAGEYERAILLFDTVINRYASSPTTATATVAAMAMFNKGYALSLYDRLEEAIIAYDQVISCFGDAKEIELRESLTDAMLNKGYLLGRLNRLEDAITVCDEVIARFGDAEEIVLRESVAKAMVNKGFTLGRLKRLDDAIAVYDEVIARFGDAGEIVLREQVAKAMVNKGIVLGQLNRNEEAVAAYDEVIEKCANEEMLHDVLHNALCNKSGILEQLGEYEGAETALRSVLNGLPDSAAHMKKMIDLYLKMPGRLDDALRTATELVGKNPEDANILNSIAWTLYESNASAALPNAAEWAYQAVSLNPDDSYCAHTLACILGALGKTDNALEHAKRYVRDTAAVEKTIEDAIELFVELAAAGKAKEALDLLENAEAIKHLEPLAVGLRMYLGEEVKTAPEIKEVAKDVVKRIEARKTLRATAR